MPTTPNLAFPYPALSDTPDVPRDVQALAVKLDGYPGIAVSRPALVTSLPGSPTDGQEVYYLADATLGILWHLRYRAASPSPYKWECVGGGSLYSAKVGVSGVTGTGAAYGDISGGPGPDITVPLAGDYEAELNAVGYNTAAGLINLSAGLTGAGGPGGQPVLVAFWGAWGGNGYGQGNAVGVLTGLGAGLIVRMRYLYTGLSTISYTERHFKLRPRRVG